MALSIIGGRASGAVIAAESGLSFWGGVDPATDHVIDAHHPLCGLPASRLADAYVEMRARPSFTCAPYLLDSAPAAGEPSPGRSRTR